MALPFVCNSLLENTKSGPTWNSKKTCVTGVLPYGNAMVAIMGGESVQCSLYEWYKPQEVHPMSDNPWVPKRNTHQQVPKGAPKSKEKPRPVSNARRSVRQGKEKEARKQNPAQLTPRARNPAIPNHDPDSSTRSLWGEAPMRSIACKEWAKKWLPGPVR